MPMDTDGFGELLTDISRMAVAMDANGAGAAAVRRILQRAAEPVETRMKANASRDPRIVSGKLHGAIHTGFVQTRRGDGKHITIGVHRKDWSNPDYVPAYVEYVRPDRALMKVV